MAAALAKRYARALVDVVTRPGAAVTSAQTAGELAAFLAAWRASVELRQVLVSPAVAPGKKRALLAQVGARLGLSTVTQNFLRVLIDHRRLPLLGEMLAAFRDLLDERQGIVRAEVTAARPVEPEQQAALAARLSEVAGRQVVPRFAVDPSLLGGVVARIGSTIYDGSVRGQLHALERRLATE